MLEAPSQSAIFGQVHLGSEIPGFYRLRQVQVGVWQACAPPNANTNCVDPHKK
jgi:hypothetical protein